METGERVRMYCFNCGSKIEAFKREDGAVKIDCPVCKSKIFSKKHTPNKAIIQITKI